jgi:hypothetical protein
MTCIRGLIDHAGSSPYRSATSRARRRLVGAVMSSPILGATHPHL